jgi:superfamily II DNA or RNA helicase
VNDGFLSARIYAYSTWQYFERAIARLFIHRGYKNVELVGGTGDKGADVIVSNYEGDFVVQVKYSKTNRDLSVDIVGDVVRAMDYYEINKGLCMSNRKLGPGQITKMKTFKSSGYDINSITSGTLLNIFDDLPKWRKDEMTPRRYQQECIAQLKASYNADEKKGLISLATGMGKTYVGCSFLKWLYEKNENINVLVLAHTNTLLEQFERSTWSFLPKTVPTYQLTGSEKPIFAGGMLFSTFQSFPKWFENHDETIFDIIIVDEAHHSPADTYQEVLNRINPRYMLGLTATPYRMDRRSVTHIFGEPLVYYDVAKGIKNGFLSQVDYRIKTDKLSKDSDLPSLIAKKSKKGYTVKQLNKKVFIEQRDDAMCEVFIDFWKSYSRDRGIIFCNSVDHALTIEKLLRNSYGIPTWSLTNKKTGSSSDHKKENVRRLREYRNGRVKILTAFDMLNEGVDVPDVDIIAFMRVTHSRTYFLQQLGRGLRLKQDNKKLLVLDFVADLRQVRAIRNTAQGYSRDGAIEHLDLGENFTIEFTDYETGEFLDLVTQDEELAFADLNHELTGF